MNLPWIIELELPSGKFSTSQLAEDISTADLDAEIRDVYGLLRQTLEEVMCSPSLSIEREIDYSEDSSAPPKIFLMVGYIHGPDVATELRNVFLKFFLIPPCLGQRRTWKGWTIFLTGFLKADPCRSRNQPAQK